MTRTLVVNIDGTDNGASDEFPTNVRKFHNALSLENQVSFYFAGPGDEDNTDGWWDRLAGMSLGSGTRDIVEKAVAALEAVYQDGDRIAATGFSRGGAATRMVCSELGEAGYSVHFLGVWDTVAAFAPFGPAQQETLFGDLHVSPSVEKAFHAVSIDEDRASFAPNLMNARDGITEMWFPGNHADVGGGYEQTGLSDATLGWMMDNARSCGLKFNPVVLNPDPSQELHREDFPLRRRARRIGVKVAGEWSDIAPLVV